MAINWEQYAANKNESIPDENINWEQYAAHKENKNNEDIKNLIVGTSPLEQIKSGLLGMGKGGENIASTLTGGYAPKAMKDVEKIVGKAKSPIAEMIGQYSPLIASAPGGLLSQMLQGGLYQGLQTPEHPISGGALGAALPIPFKILGGLGKIIGGAVKGIKPYEQSLESAANKSELANQQAISPKPGLYEHPKSELESIENEIGKHINIEGEHGARASNAITNRVKSIENYWGNAYQDFLKKIQDKKFHMPEQSLSHLEYDPSEIMKRLQKGADPRKIVSQIEKERNFSEQNPYYKNLISKAPTSQDINAADFIAKHKDFRDTLGGLKADLKSDRYGSIEKQQIKSAIDKGKEVEDQIKKTLSEGLGDFKPEFDFINKGYSEQIYPLRSNPLVKSAKKGKMPDNILKSLRTNEQGMDVLRNIIKQDPELLRNVIGQRYLQKPGSIYNPNELTREFLDEMPEFKQLLSQREKTLSELVKQKDISLKEHIKAQKELSDIKKSRSKKRKTLLYGAGVLGVPSALKYGSKLLSSLQEGSSSE